MAAESDTFPPGRYCVMPPCLVSDTVPFSDLVVNLLAAKAHQEGVITIIMANNGGRSYTCATWWRAMGQILETPVGLISGEVFNVGDTRLNHTLNDISDIIQGIFPNVRIEYEDNSDLRNYRVKFDKIRNLTGFRALYTVRDGVEEFRKAFDEGLILDYMNLRYHNQRYLKALGSLGDKDGFDAWSWQRSPITTWVTQESALPKYLLPILPSPGAVTSNSLPGKQTSTQYW